MNYELDIPDHIKRDQTSSDEEIEFLLESWLSKKEQQVVDSLSRRGCDLNQSINRMPWYSPAAFEIL